MRKFLLLAVLAVVFASCKKELMTNVKTNVALATLNPDSILLVSSITSTSIYGNDTTLYDYCKCNWLQKLTHDFSNGLERRDFYYYNQNGSIKLISYTQLHQTDVQTVVYKYNSAGVLISDYVQEHPEIIDTYLTSGNKVTRKYYFLYDPANQGKVYDDYTYDGDNLRVLRKVDVTQFSGIDSIVNTYQYNTHKNAFYYSRIKYLINDPNFPSFLQLPGGNDPVSLTQIEYFPDGTPPLTVYKVTYTSTYNADDLPVHVVATIDEGPLLNGSKDHYDINYDIAYVKVHK